MNYANTTAYLKSATERELATLQRRTALIGADELERLGALTFTEDEDIVQEALDFLASRAAMVAVGMKCSEPAIDQENNLEIDRVLLAAGFTLDVVKALRGYADAHAARSVSRDATVNGNGAATNARATDAPPATYRGTWKDGATYARGGMVTHGGCLWHAETDKATGRPGQSADWKLMHKSLERAGR